MNSRRFRIAAIIVVVVASSQGCSTIKTLNPIGDTFKSSNSNKQPVEDTAEASMTSEEKRISLLHAKASLAEMDNLRGEAIESYEAILDMDSNDVKALHRLALLHIQQCDYQDADESFQQAIEIAPQNGLLRNDYGYFCHLQNRPDQAIEHLTKAVELSPEYLAAHNNLGLVLAGQERRDAAERHFRLAKCDQAEALNNLALARLMEADFDDAESLYNQALTVDPNQEQAKSSLATVDRISRQRQVIDSEVSVHRAVVPASFGEVQADVTHQKLR